MNRELVHYYRKFRAHQWANDGGGAWPGFHAAAALQSARAHMNFMKRMKDYTAPKKRRAKNNK